LADVCLSRVVLRARHALPRFSSACITTTGLRNASVTGIVLLGTLGLYPTGAAWLSMSTAWMLACPVPADFGRIVWRRSTYKLLFDEQYSI
jgi:hypothetical protein